MKNFALTMVLAFAIGTKIAYSQQLDEEYKGYKVYKSISKARKNPLAVVVLDLSNCGMRVLPEELAHFQNLRFLSIYGNKITELPDALWTLKNLEVLNISSNGLDSLPKKIGLLKSLRILYASRNNLSNVPFEIVDLKNLNRLDLTYNNLRESDVEFIHRSLPNCFVIVYDKL